MSPAAAGAAHVVQGEQQPSNNPYDGGTPTGHTPSPILNLWRGSRCWTGAALAHRSAGRAPIGPSPPDGRWGHRNPARDGITPASDRLKERSGPRAVSTEVGE